MPNAAMISKVLRPTTRTATRLLSSSKCLRTAYDSDGKTTVTTLNAEPGTGIMVNSLSQMGFRLNNGMFIVGPVALFRSTVLSWNVEGDHDINESSLNLFGKIEPKLDLLVVGFGGDPSFNMKLRQVLLPFYNKTKINLEVLPSEKAAATFNFLSSEGRHVAAALIPPLKVQLSYDEIAKTNLENVKV